MRQIIFILVVLVLMFSCYNASKSKVSSGISSASEYSFPANNDGRSNENDCLDMVHLLQAVYKWHDQHQKELQDFDVVTKDSFQTRLNYTSFNKTFNAIKKTGYFSTSFIRNYKQIGDYINEKLVNANHKYLNEINFAFQEADPWTNFQDDPPEFWNKLKIADFKSSSDKASLQWQTESGHSYSGKYLVKFEKENGKWKVAFVEGFDMKKYYQ